MSSTSSTGVLSSVKRRCDECGHYGRVRRDFIGAECAEPITCHGCGQQDSHHSPSQCRAVVDVLR